jgi:hypothetical protein
MEILIGLMSTGIVELIKLLSQKYGKELSERIVHVIVFLICFMGAYSLSAGILTMDMVKYYIGIFTTAYTTYKLILNPALKVVGAKL